jgi:hypothetical protein
VKPYHAHSHSPNGRDRGPTTVNATSRSWGDTDLGPAFSMFGKRCYSLRQGQKALPLARLDYLRAERTFCIFLRA